MKLDRTLNYFAMIKKCVETTANPYFYDRCEKKKETKNEIFFLVRKISIQKNLKTNSEQITFFKYKLFMVSSRWKGEKDGYETLHGCKSCLPEPWKMLEKIKKAFK